MITFREKAAIGAFIAMMTMAIVLNALRAIRPDEPSKPEVPVVPFEDVHQVYIPPEVTPEPAPEPPPEEFNLAVPFTSQAPTGNWNALFEDACEEASFLMVQRFYVGEQAADLPPQATEQELQAMVAWQTARGFGPSITAAEFLSFIEGYAGVTGAILENPTPEQLRTAIRAGKPVIVPAAGRRLQNPYFSGEGPLYHMLVLRGYTADGFIANDPGTRHGKGYFYPTNTLMNAIGDWNGGDPENGAKRVITVDN